MGTNYYANYEIDGKLVHLGKNSFGWEFNFHSAFGCTSWRELKGFLQHSKLAILSEEKKYLSVEEFSTLVENTRVKRHCLKNEPKNHFFWAIEANLVTEHDWIDSDGWAFSSVEFS